MREEMKVAREETKEAGKRETEALREAEHYKRIVTGIGEKKREILARRKRAQCEGWINAQVAIDCQEGVRREEMAFEFRSKNLNNPSL